ncbi:hypothetical protein H8356DRAFT_1342069 [Neocallimastix lanati (nom. inval.)]|nr:hypothetical protein H8356DRAFT_1342069 [Neocallimastix sp. JGI-2020a]
MINCHTCTAKETPYRSALRDPQGKAEPAIERVGPLRREGQQLEETDESTKVKADEIIKVINELEVSIARKQEYAVLIKFEPRHALSYC